MKTYFKILLASGFFFACENDKNQEQVVNDSSSETQIDQKAEQKNCQLTTFSFQLGDKERKMNFTYENDLINSIEISEMGSEDTQKLSYVVNADGQLQEFVFDNNKASYQYNESGLLTEIVGDGNLNSRVFEYDDQNRMVKQITLFGGKPYTTHQYEYKEDVPVKVDVMMKDKLYESYELEYDNKHNPFLNKGIFVNSTEMIYGYAVGNYNHNVVRVITTNNKGESDTKEVTYEYNENGYPIKATRKQGDKEMSTTLDFDCQ